MTASGSPEHAGRGVRVVLVTAPDAETAGRLARAVVEEGRAACANLLPGVTSWFRWAGEVQRAEEVLMILKCGDDGIAALRERVIELHPYDVPEFLVVPVAGGHPPYLDWVLGTDDERGEVAG